MNQASAQTIPLYLRVLGGVLFGVMMGVIFGSHPIVFGVKNADLGRLGLLVVKLLKALAVPLVFFAILDAFVKTDISWKKGVRLIFICVFNASVALVIGLSIMNAVQPGRRFANILSSIISAGEKTDAAASELIATSKKASLGLVDNLAGYVPKSLVDPFSENSVITIVLLGLLLGAALRRARKRGYEGEGPDTGPLEKTIESIYAVLIETLDLVVKVVPFAVFGVVADVVGKSGIAIFQSIWIYLLTVLVAMAVHSLVYYPLAAWFIGKKPPRMYLGYGADAILTGLSTNSSLATVPITLKALDKMKVSPESSRLAACIGTNLNNDGILLYEAMTAIFLTQALGVSVGLSGQVTIALASMMAAAGVAGIPEAGLVVLPLVLGAAGLSDSVIAAAIPLVMTVDWLIARCRSGVNVMADMLVAIMLDAPLGQSKAKDSAGDQDRPST